MNPKKFCEIAEAAGYTPCSYSGRGMYGKECVGITIRRGNSAFTLAMNMAYHAGEELQFRDEILDILDSLSRFRVCEDSMGLDSIVYFPEIPWPKDYEAPNEDDDGDENDWKVREG